MSYQGKHSGADIDRLLDKIDNMESVVVDDTITPESSNPVTSKAIYKTMESNEKVAAAALCEIDTRVKKLPTTEVVDNKVSAAVEGLQTTIETNYSTLDGKIDAEVATLAATITSNEKVAAAALNDLNNRIQDLANSVIGALNTEV